MAKPVRQFLTAIVCLIGIGIILTTIYSHQFEVVENNISTTTAQIGSKLLSYDSGGFILPFEVISVVLLAAMIGGIVIAKGKKLNEKNDN
jgi:NADH-quinone oxidoreductase subunit J